MTFLVHWFLIFFSKTVLEAPLYNNSIAAVAQEEYRKGGYNFKVIQLPVNSFGKQN
jgi:hypothetical protein